MIRIKFSEDALNLYVVGYLSVDLHQLAIFSHLLETQEIDKAEAYFGKGAFSPNRYSRVYDTRAVSTNIKRVKEGSLELVVDVTGTIAQILMPLLAIWIDRRLNRRGERVIFEVDPTDRTLTRLLDAYQDSVLGDGDASFEYLMGLLQQSGYDVRVLGRNAFLIEHVLDRYAQRAVRTIKKYRR